MWKHNLRGYWVAEITYKRKSIKINCNDFIDAVIARLNMEVEYFGEFRSTRNDEYLSKLLNDNGYRLNDILNKQGR